METYEGYIKYNDDKKCYGMMGHDGNWVKEQLENGDRIDIVINGERFATNFKNDFSLPVLDPHPWDNWEFLAGLPAAYYDFEETAKEKQITKKEERHLRYKSAILLIGLSLAISAVLGGIFALIDIGDGTFLEAFAHWFLAMFLYFGAGTAAGGILMLANIMPEPLCIGFGCALYYGTILLSVFLSNFVYGPGSNRYFISFVIVSLVCYIVWLQNFKPNDSK